MKTLPLVLLSAMLLLVPVAGNAQNTARDTLTDAQRAYMRGDVDKAKQGFKMVLELDPHNVTALNYMRMIATQEKATGQTGAQREKQLQALIIPHVELNEATFGTALDYLKQSAAKEGVTDVNFVVKVPADVVDSKKVTLSLTKIPFTEVLRYMGELTGVKFSIEKYAIVVKSPEASSVTSAVPAAPAATP